MGQAGAYQWRSVITELRKKMQEFLVFRRELATSLGMPEVHVKLRRVWCMLRKYGLAAAMLWNARIVDGDGEGSRQGRNGEDLFWANQGAAAAKLRKFYSPGKVQASFPRKSRTKLERGSLPQSPRLCGEFKTAVKGKKNSTNRFRRRVFSGIREQAAQNNESQFSHSRRRSEFLRTPVSGRAVSGDSGRFFSRRYAGDDLDPYGGMMAKIPESADYHSSPEGVICKMLYLTTWKIEGMPLFMPEEVIRVTLVFTTTSLQNFSLEILITPNTSSEKLVFPRIVVHSEVQIPVLEFCISPLSVREWGGGFRNLRQSFLREGFRIISGESSSQEDLPEPLETRSLEWGFLGNLIGLEICLLELVVSPGLENSGGVVPWVSGQNILGSVLSNVSGNVENRTVGWNWYEGLIFQASRIQESFAVRRR
nr:berberine bridge enzyme-like 15 [Ipomoea batatas]